MENVERELRSMLEGESAHAVTDCALQNATLRMEWLDWLGTVRDRQPRTIQKYGRTSELWLEWLGPQSLLTASVTQMEQFCSRPRSGRSEGLLGAAGTRREPRRCTC